MSRTALPAPLTDGRMWRKLLATVHPDSGGSDELFVWVTGLKEVVCELPASARNHGQMGGFGRRPARASGRSAGARKAADEEPDRVPFDPSVGFDELTSRALHLAESGEVEGIYVDLLVLLEGCTSDSSGQHRGASYKQLAACGHAAGFTKLERRGWYGVGELVPLSETHALYLLEALRGAA